VDRWLNDYTWLFEKPNKATDNNSHITKPGRFTDNKPKPVTKKTATKKKAAKKVVKKKPVKKTVSKPTVRK